MNSIPFRTARDVRDACPQVAAHLAADRVLAYPTETVYGLGCRPTAAAVAALIRIKGRKPGKPFLLLIAGVSMAERLDLVFNDAARAMADAFWPGPLTLVLPGAESTLPDSLRGPEGGVAVRWTSHAGIARLLDYLGYPITSTSANRPGSSPAPGAGGVLETFKADVASGQLMVLDGGVLGNVPSSTLIDCTGRVPVLIREGAIRRAELHAKVGSLAP